MAIGVPTLFSQMSGAVGDIVLTRNRYASTVIRANTFPTDPSTAGQVTNRGFFQDAVTAWHTRPLLDHLSWKQYADHTPWFNKLGQECRLTGFNMYVAVFVHNKNQTVGFDQGKMDTAPVTPGMLPLCPMFFQDPAPPTPVITGFRIFVQNNSLSETISVGIWMSHGHPLTKNFFKGPYDPGISLKITSILPGNVKNRTVSGLTINTRSFLRLRSYNAITRNRISRYQYQHVDTSLSS